MLVLSEGVSVLTHEKEVILVNLKRNSFIKIRKEAWEFLNKFIKNTSKECLTEVENAEREAFFRLLTYLKDNKYLEESSSSKEICNSDEELENAFFESSRSAYYEVTEYCNLKCRFCYANPKYKLEKFNGNLELSKKILDKAKEININRIILSGGEPLLRKDIFEIIKYAKYKIGKVAITTNGTLIDEDVAKKLKDSGIDSVSISIESFDKSIHDNLRGVGTFEKCLNAIEALKKVGFDKSSLNICATTTRKNLEGLSRFRKFANDLGVSMNFSFFQPAGRGKFSKDLHFSDQEYLNFLVSLLDTIKEELIQQIDSSSSFNLSYDKINKKFVPSLKNHCGMVINLIGIKESGELVPCHLFFSLKSNDMVIGNIFDEDILTKMWNFFKKSPTVDQKEGCKECNVRYFCGGGCYGGTFFESGTFNKPNPFCEVLKKYYSSIVWCLGKDNENECFYKALSNYFDK